MEYLQKSQVNVVILLEHGVTKEGKNPDTSDDGSFRCFFEETNGGLLVLRNLCVDLEPNVIDDIRNGYVCYFFPFLYFFKNVFLFFVFLVFFFANK